MCNKNDRQQNGLLPVLFFSSFFFFLMIYTHMKRDAWLKCGVWIAIKQYRNDRKRRKREKNIQILEKNGFVPIFYLNEMDI